MCTIVLVFCVYPMYLIYADYFFYLNKVLILFLFTIFLRCVWFLSLTNYVQFILYANILTDIFEACV